MRVVKRGQVLDVGALFSQRQADIVEFALESQMQQSRQYSSSIDGSTIARTKIYCNTRRGDSFCTRVAYLNLVSVGPRASSSVGCHRPLPRYKARHRSPYPRVHSHECSFLQRHPLLQAVAKAQGCLTAWLAEANRVSPVLMIAKK